MIVPGPGIAAKEIDISDLDRLCRASTLANFKRPRGYVILEELPVSAGGKLQRMNLRKQVEVAQKGKSRIVLQKI